MPSLSSLLRDTLFTLRYVPSQQLLALAKHRLRSLRQHAFGNPWPHRIQRMVENEWPETRKRVLPLTPLSPSRPYEQLLSQWRRFQGGTIVLVNREESFSPSALWEHFDTQQLPPLVIETLHYHQFLVDLGELLVCPEADEPLRVEVFSTLLALLDSWWVRYPVGQPPAWGAFATAFRIRSWLWVHRWLSGCLEPQARNLEEIIEKRVFIQGLCLEQNLERHLGGNHLFKDICAMALLASFFEGPTANRWFALIERDLLDELKLQVLPDGGHYERSPMYQCLVLSDLLDAAEFLSAWNPSFVAGNLLDPIERMTHFLAGILHPDGEIPLFNDSVLGQSVPALGMLARAGEGWGGGKVSLSTFPDTGITRLNQDDLTCLIDHGRLGPDELMGHVHNDTLSFELSVGDERFIVDKGVYEYTAGPRRTECRSIRSHNTPSVEGFEQAETWASFRVARRWHILSAKVSEEPRGIIVQGEWERPGMGWIGRRFATDPVGSLMISDEIRCEQPCPCQIPFLFAPGIGVTVYPHQGSTQWWRWEARSRDHVLCGWTYSSTPLQVIVEDTVSWPRFYTELPSARIVIQAEVPKSIVVFTYFATDWDVFKGFPRGEESHLNQGEPV